MPRCPNCNYKLVLIEHRRKYKCAKCGKLFSQKEIDDKEFRELNNKRRAEAKKEARKEYCKQYVRENKDKFKVWAKKNYEKNKEKIREKQKEYYEKHKEELSEKAKEKRRQQTPKEKEKYNFYKRGYWASHNQEVLQKKKKNYQKRKAEILVNQRLYWQINPTLSRIKHLREQQKLLALRTFEFSVDKTLNAQIPEVLPTISLSYLLISPKTF